MRRAFAVCLLCFSLSAEAQYVGAASLEQTGDLSQSFSDLWKRLFGPKPTPVPLPTNVPARPAADDTLGRLVSWNVQVLGKNASAAKKSALRLGLGRALRGSAPTLLAVQEISNDAGARALARQLPGEGKNWTTSFTDSSDSQNNALYFGPGIRVDCSRSLDLPGVLHPPRMAHVTVQNADFTVLSIHLTYAKGKAAASAAELKIILAWLRAEMAKPNADPDFIIAGDFNLPTRKGKTLSMRSGETSWAPLEDSIGPGVTALIDDPTSRHGRENIANNYDHFIVTDDFMKEELVEAAAISPADIALAEREAGTRASDHFPIAMTFRKSGAGRDGRPVAIDGPSTCR
ncbi:MAG: endonuclease/exonuclease/phosphatase family protein [Elusimicrobia bacterium]|nr:endonuclease/exonuclease/phosphatase family protein [Elusimicrobiota bacterium]